MPAKIYFNPSLFPLALPFGYKTSMIARICRSTFGRCVCTGDPFYWLQKGRGRTQWPWEIILLLWKKCQRTPLCKISFQALQVPNTVSFQPENSGYRVHGCPPFLRKDRSQQFWVRNSDLTEGSLVSNLCEQCQPLRGGTTSRREAE